MKLFWCFASGAAFLAVLLLMCGYAPVSWAPLLMPIMNGENAKLVWIVVELLLGLATVILLGEHVCKRLEAKLKAGFEPNANAAPPPHQSLFAPWFQNPLPKPNPYTTILPASVTTTKTTYAPVVPLTQPINTAIPPAGPSPILSPPPPLPTPPPDSTPGPIVRANDGLDEERDILRTIFAKHAILRQEVLTEAIHEYLEACNRGDTFS